MQLHLSLEKENFTSESSVFPSPTAPKSMTLSDWQLSIPKAKLKIRKTISIACRKKKKE